MKIKVLYKTLINLSVFIIVYKEESGMEYITYLCKTCRKEFILPTDELESNTRKGKYISCCYCGDKSVRKVRETDSIKECMKGRRYMRNKHGALVQK